MKTNMTVIVAALAVAIITSGCGSPRSQRRLKIADPAPAPAIAAPANPDQNATAPTATPGGLTTAVVTTPTSPTTKSVAVDPSNGVSNGVPCLFVNKAASALTVTVVMEGGVSFTFDLPANGKTTLRVPPGTYSYTWTVEDDTKVYQGDTTFPVTKTPTKHFLNAGKWESYNGGVLFGGK